jgi:hypothetical protein
LLKLVLEEVDLCDSPLGGHNEANFSAAQVPLIQFSKKAVTETKKSASSGQPNGAQTSRVTPASKASSTDVKSERKGEEPLSKQICMAHLKGVLGLKDPSGKDVKCRSQECRRTHVKKGVDFQDKIFEKLYFSERDNKDEEKIRSLVKQHFKKG